MATTMTKAEEILGGFTSAATAANRQFDCARCGKTLTDPASIEHGWGPECRKLANEAYATMIPANVVAVLAVLATVTYLQGTLADAVAAVVAEINEGAESGRSDWRGVANVLVRIVAYGPGAVKHPLCNAVEALGYVTLAAVAREEASPSPAEVAVVDGRVTLKTKKNPAANATIKAIHGRKFDMTTKVWSFPATEFRAVLAVVTKYFPTTKLNVLALATEVAKAINDAAAKQATMTATIAPLVPAKPVATVKVTPAPNGYHVESPYKASFVADLKTSLPSKARAWNGNAKCWWVATDVIEAVQTMIAKHYGETARAA